MAVAGIHGPFTSGSGAVEVASGESVVGGNVVVAGRVSRVISDEPPLQAASVTRSAPTATSRDKRSTRMAHEGSGSRLWAS